MKYSTNNLPKKTLIATLVSSAIAVSVQTQAQELTQVKSKLSVTGFSQATGYEKGVRAEKQFPNYYIVQLEDEPLATYKGHIEGFAATNPKVRGEDQVNVNSAAAESYKTYLQQKQSQVIQELRQRIPGLEVQDQLNIVLNGLVVAVPAGKDAKNAIRQIPGIKRVYDNEMRYANMDQSIDLINAPEVWDQLGGQTEAGKGVKVAIIDGGINPEHPMFADSGHDRPEGLPGNDYCATIDPSFCNDKLALARFYTPTFMTHPNEFLSPRDLGGHGTHVAGTAVGNPVSTTFNGVDVNLSGVAPGASLMVYKALFQNTEGRGSGSDAMLVSAVEDAVADGADVINNSWGSGPGNPATNVYTPLFEAAEEAGIVVATAAGNSGPGPVTVGCPSCAESGLSVASTQHGRTFNNLVSASGLEDIVAYPGDGDFVIEETITAPLMPAAQIDGENAEACSEFPAGSFEGHIAFVPRGTCAFADKAANVQAAGAVGMILQNNQEGIIIMSMPGATLPSVSISQVDGKAIADAWEEGDEATITPSQMLINEDAIDAMSDFSSRGPNFEASFLKPDIAAPGSDILSAYAGEADSYNMIGGTSMASPHVAGAAALLRQKYPDYDAIQLKSLLMNSANPNVVKEDLETPATPFDMGAGRLDVAAAASAGLTFDISSIASNGCLLECEFTRVATNLAESDVEWDVKVEFDNPNVVGEVEGGTLAIEANSTAEFKLHVDTTYASEGWAFGQVTFTDPTGTFPDAKMPIAIMADNVAEATVANTTSMTGLPVPGGTTTMVTTAGGSGSNEVSMVTTHIPEGTTLDPASVTVETQYAMQNLVNVSADGSMIKWAGFITTPESTLTESSFPLAGASLVDSGFGMPLGCSASTTACDEITATLGVTGLGVTWGGKAVSAISLSENGFIAMGDQTVGGTYFNTPLPATSVPNEMLAPLWIDMEIGGDNESDIFYDIVNDGTNDWLAIEWYKARTYGDTSGTSYTFSVWQNLNTGATYFNYADVAEMPEVWGGGATIGFEDVSGRLGTQYYYNGEGTPVTSGDALETNLDTRLGKVSISYDVMVDEVASVEKPEAFTMGYDETREFDLNSFTATDMRTKSEVVHENDGAEFIAVLPFDIKAEGELKVVITQQPTNGTLEQVTETITNEEDEEVEQPVPGHYVYTPNEEYMGEESFAYVVEDEAGVATSEQVVTFTVAEPNDPPAVTSPNGDVNADGEVAVAATTGGSVTLTVEASDADEDELTYSWTQVSGPEVEFEANEAGNAITFAAPSSAANIVFEATVSDGRHDVTQAFNVSVTAPVDTGDGDNNSGGGGGSSSSFGFLVGLLALPFAILRRRMAARK